MSYTIHQQMHYYKTDMSRIESPEYDPRDEYGEGVAGDKLQIVHKVLAEMGDTSRAIAEAIVASPNRDPSYKELAAATGKSEEVVRQTFHRWDKKVAQHRQLKPNAVRTLHFPGIAPKEKAQRSDKGHRRPGYNEKSLGNLKNAPMGADGVAFRRRIPVLVEDEPAQVVEAEAVTYIPKVQTWESDGERMASLMLDFLIGQVENYQHQKVLFMWRDSVHGDVIAKRLNRPPADVFRIIERFQKDLSKNPLPRLKGEPKPVVEKSTKPVQFEAPHVGGYGIHIVPQSRSTNYKKTALYGELRQAAFENLKTGVDGGRFEESNSDDGRLSAAYRAAKIN